MDDWYDIFDEDPYKIEEVVPGKVWSVTYSFVDENAFNGVKGSISKSQHL